jgi:hypothetical protein
MPHRAHSLSNYPYENPSTIHALESNRAKQQPGHTPCTKLITPHVFSYEASFFLRIYQDLSTK